MFRCPLLYKLWLAVAALTLVVVALSVSGFQGVYAYRLLARTISQRAAELPLAAELTRCVGDLRVTLSQMRRTRGGFPGSALEQPVDRQLLREQFRASSIAVQDALDRYRMELDSDEPTDPLIGDIHRERETVAEIEKGLARVAELNRDEDWMFDDLKAVALEAELEHLHQMSSRLPSFLQQRMHDFAGDARSQYRTWILVSWTTCLSAVTLILIICVMFYLSVFRPLGVLIAGSRRVAGGDFDHRIVLHTADEVSDLAQAMNGMTQRFQEIRDDLDQQVKQRTKEVVQGEKLASVGFLAAGVAHEINNPLASIAWCAESLESRLHDIVQADDEQPDDEHNEQITVLKKYLRVIQDEAFRCKGITERLLDYSRLGDMEKQSTDLGELVEGVIGMVRHLGRYREKKIEFTRQSSVVAPVNPQELKQVVLNLITNGLDSLEPGGKVTITLGTSGREAELVVSDNGCGMTPEVMEHLYEPFFTRRRDGQGTGLGLSISYRIVVDHGGNIEAHSDGPGHGSRFRVTLPLFAHEKTSEKRQAA